MRFWNLSVRAVLSERDEMCSSYRGVKWVLVELTYTKTRVLYIQNHPQVHPKPPCGVKLIHSEKSIPPPLNSWSISANPAPKDASPNRLSGNCVRICGCPSCLGVENAAEQSRSMTSKQRMASWLLLRDGCERRFFVVLTSRSQLDASGSVGLVVRKMMGIKAAWKRKYLRWGHVSISMILVWC